MQIKASRPDRLLTPAGRRVPGFATAAWHPRPECQGCHGTRDRRPIQGVLKGWGARSGRTWQDMKGPPEQPEFAADEAQAGIWAVLEEPGFSTSSTRGSSLPRPSQNAHQIPASSFPGPDRQSERVYRARMTTREPAELTANCPLLARLRQNFCSDMSTLQPRSSSTSQRSSKPETWSPA